MILPDRELELALLTHHEAVVGIDEVGRGALAGPVMVGVAVVTRATGGAIPEGLRDSKLVPAGARASVAERAGAWVAGSAVGAAEPWEIDQRGIVGALRLAASRALEALLVSGAPVPTAAILDGAHNWLEPDLLDVDLPHLAFPQVVVRPKADASCAVVAAASVIAKVRRDAHMCGLEDPGYGFGAHKGYGAPLHLEALGRLGACDHHRRSWRLPGVHPAPEPLPVA
ncbi:MAG: ribonuclease HII [bacterium]|nr:ribonuclease HII [bacterium]